ncbi:hypothetical protein LZC95_35215 [Pendulispora brunnea]|uniref:Glutamine amidotransferase type-2 domain-containing protein n=1 Tax=Pendulispora brunnea TaxID=2905690 RepID=A0ABZ2K299_9BACT
MSLLGVISRQPVHLRSIASKGGGGGFVVREASKNWSKSIALGDGGMIAVHSRSSDWTTLGAEAASHLQARELTGDVFVATLPAVGDDCPLGGCMLQTSSWHFAYEGAIGDGDALRRALDPMWCPPDVPPNGPGELIFALILSHIVREGAAITADVAMAKAAADLHRARSLGPVAFICANGTNLYAYSFGRKLAFKNVPEAIVVGSPEVLAEGPTTRRLQDGALVVLAKRPHLGWAILAHP